MHVDREKEAPTPLVVTHRLPCGLDSVTSVSAGHVEDTGGGGNGLGGGGGSGMTRYSRLVVQPGLREYTAVESQ
jgi:hypothetical protein